MPKLPKISIDISDPEVKKMLQKLFIWVEHDFALGHTRDWEIGTWKHYKSVGDDMASKFYSKAKKVKLSYYQSVALFELIEFYPDKPEYIHRQLNSQIHPHLDQLKNKNPQLSAKS
jgi:hypothetical protein